MANDILRDDIPNSTPEFQPIETKKRRKKIPGIYQRGSRWAVDTFYKGHRLRESFATPEMAETNLRKLKTLIDEDRYLEIKRESKETVGQFAERYLQWCRDIGQKAVESKQSHMDSIQSHFGKDILLSKITRADIEKYQATLMSCPSQRKASIKPATVNRRMACLRHMLSKAVEWKVLSDHPCRGVKQFKENNQRVRFLTVEECKTLLDACPNPTLKQVIELALNTGMRKSELLHLKRDHVNLRQGFLEILDQKNGEYDTLPLNKTAMELLRSIPPHLDSEYVFAGRIAGKPFWDLKRQVEKAVSDSKLEGVTFHTLRHTAASHMVMNGVDLLTVMKILRHKDYATTLRYAHLAPGHKQAAVNTLGDVLNVQTEKSTKTA
jgi:site-specific recombinase XerD